MSKTGHVTELLHQWQNGDSSAFSKLVDTVFANLHEIAHRQLGKEFRASQMKTTELLNHTILSLMENSEKGKKNHWENRGHFYSAMGEAMRHYLVDLARKRKTVKHGGHLSAIPYEHDLLGEFHDADKTLAIHQALEQIKQEDPELVHMVELRFFCGFTIPEAAKMMGVSETHISRKWSFARAWLSTLLDEANLP